MKNLFTHIGMGTVVQKERVIFITAPGSATAQRYMDDAKKKNKLHNATLGHKFRSLVVMDDGTVLISCIKPLTLMKRMNSMETVEDEDTEEEEEE